MWLLVSFFKY